MREAAEDDVSFISGLFKMPHVREYLNDPGRDAILANVEGTGEEAFILTRDGKDEGYFTLRDHEWLIELGVLAVKEPGHGSGSFAMRWGIAEAFDRRNAHRIFIEIREDNDSARAMCEHIGFKAEGLYRDGFRDAASGEYKNLIPYGMLRADSLPGMR